jgi:hypothetical protein
MQVQNTNTNFKAIHIKGNIPLDTYIKLYDTVGIYHILDGKKPTDHFIRTEADSKTEKVLLENLRKIAPELEFFSIMNDLVDHYAKPFEHHQRNNNIRFDFHNRKEVNYR